MLQVERGNVVLDIKDDELQHYLNLGYDLRDESGHILQRAMPTDIGTLQLRFVEQEKTIKELQAKIEALTEECSALKKSKAQSKPQK